MPGGQKQKLHVNDPHKLQASVFEGCRDGSEYYWDEITVTHVSLGNFYLRRFANFLHVLDRSLSGFSIRLVGESW